MTRRWIASILLIIMALIFSWYAYQEYKRMQQGPELFIEAS